MHWISWKSLLPLVLAAGGGLMWHGRVRTERNLQSPWDELVGSSETELLRFDSSMVADLPPPAQRYLRRAIQPGTPLSRSVTLQMHGSMRLQPDADLLSMEAEQVLAPPKGLIWKAHVGGGFLRLQGFDRFTRTQGELRWWAYGLVPVVRASGPDVDRSAAGRVAGEAVLVPATLLPVFGTHWEPVDDRRARYTMHVGGEPVQVTVTIDEEGRLEQVYIRRWRGDLDDGSAGYDAFDVDQFDSERTFGGYSIPTSFRAGWRLSKPDAFPFFFATIDHAEFHH